MSNLVAELEREAAYADNMAAMAALWMQKAQEAERALAVAVYAAGGEIKVHRDHLIDAPDLELTKVSYDHDMTTRLRVRKKQPPQAFEVSREGGE